MDFYGKHLIGGRFPVMAIVGIVVCLVGAVIAVACRPYMNAKVPDDSQDAINAVAKGTSNQIDTSNLAMMQARENFDIATCNMVSMPETDSICRFSLAVPDILMLPDNGTDLTGVESALRALENCDDGDLPNSVSFVLINADTGSAMAFNAGTPMYPASSIKAMFSYYILSSRSDEISEYDRQLIEDVILYSDNDSYYSLICEYAGEDAIEWFARYGIDFSGYAEDTYPALSAKSASMIWRDILSYIESGSEDAIWFSDLLSSTSVSFARDAATGQFGQAMLETGDAIDVVEEKTEESESDLVVYNKAGWIVDWEVNALADCGVIRDADGTRYIFAFITDAAESSETIQTFENLIQEVWATRSTLD